jgi:hypothetical protein
VTVTVNYASSNGTAQAGSDYTSTAGVLTFTPGQTSQTFTVPIINDNLYESTETVFLSLSNANQATLGSVNPATLIIVNNDPAPKIEFNYPSYSVAENAGVVIIATTLNTASALTTTVKFTTSNGTAVAGSDYVATSGVLTFAPGQIRQTFSVTIINDALVEPNQTVRLTLSNPTNATLSFTNPVTLTIIDDDFEPKQVYLPLILHDFRLPLKLSLKNETGGTLQYSIFGTPQGNIICPVIPVGGTAFCGEFSSGRYQVRATSTGPGCGSETVTLDFPAGVCTRIVRCGQPSVWQCQ